MPPTDPIGVARHSNEVFSSIPFEELREMILSADSYAEVVAGLERLGAEVQAELIDPEVEVEIGGFEGGAAIAGGGGRGHQAWHRFWQEWLEPWQDLSFEPTGYEGLGDGHVLVEANITARGRLGGVPAELSVCQLWTVRDGRVVRYAVHPSRESAMEALSREPGEARMTGKEKRTTP